MDALEFGDNYGRYARNPSDVEGVSRIVSVPSNSESKTTISLDVKDILLIIAVITIIALLIYFLYLKEMRSLQKHRRHHYDY